MGSCPSCLSCPNMQSFEMLGDIVIVDRGRINALEQDVKRLTDVLREYSNQHRELVKITKDLVNLNLIKPTNSIEPTNSTE